MNRRIQILFYPVIFLLYTSPSARAEEDGGVGETGEEEGKGETGDGEGGGDNPYSLPCQAGQCIAAMFGTEHLPNGQCSDPKAYT